MQRNLLRLILLLVVLAITATGCGDGLSTIDANSGADDAASTPSASTSAWIFDGTSEVVLARWTADAAGTLSGVIRAATLDPDGTVNDETYNVSGVQSGNSITLASDLGLGTKYSWMAETNGDELTLYWPEDDGTYAEMSLTLGSIGQYNQAVTNLQARAAATVATGEEYVGMCLDWPADDVFTATQSIPCYQLHDIEIYAIVALPNTRSAPYPGDDAVYEAALDTCLGEFEPSFGVPYDESEIYIDAFTPTRAGWDQGADRTVDCVAFHVDAAGTGIVKTSSSLLAVDTSELPADW